MAFSDFWRGIVGRFGSSEGQKPSQPEGIASKEEEEPQIKETANEEKKV